MEKKAENVRTMFGSIAHRYDLLNHLLSFSTDRYWRHVTAKKLSSYLSPNSLVLDLCTGTGDMAIALGRLCRVVGCDFCHPMLILGIQKAKKRELNGSIHFVEGDALNLPFPSRYFHAVTIAFGLRNLEDYARGIREMGRVLRSGGVLAILEFSQPRLPVFRQTYLFYFTCILPKLGEWISGSSGPYSYLPDSVQRFPSPEALERMLEESGFKSVRRYSLTGGIATLHIGVRYL